ncbi:hypothetical protein [Culicoidibacter larvae]|uniref:Uncharacterized protein n=1 Tax=Culicoidibacter larvae TaxID=2579976 RepID=A0A5R8QH24_9FIRM|nr:hypothetical protein [Culicoidibacter larvae]TLG77329.1 hypothetical protein FEZ08_01545 [Culicoidibacter larvae]
MIQFTHHEFAILAETVKQNRIAVEAASGTTNPFDVTAITTYSNHRKKLIQLEDKLEAAMLQE